MLSHMRLMQQCKGGHVDARGEGSTQIRPVVPGDSCCLHVSKFAILVMFFSLSHSLGVQAFSILH